MYDSKLNAFFAVFADEAGESAVAAWQERINSGKPQKFAKCHVTLCYLTSHPDDWHLFAMGLRLPAEVRAFKMRLVKPENWTRVAVLTSTEDNPDLERLRNAVTEAVEAAGLQYDPRWTPHMTLGRGFAVHWAPQPLTDLPPVELNARTLKLVTSRGGTYTIIKEWSLQ